MLNQNSLSEYGETECLPFREARKAEGPFLDRRGHLAGKLTLNNVAVINNQSDYLHTLTSHGGVTRLAGVQVRKSAEKAEQPGSDCPNPEQRQVGVADINDMFGPPTLSEANTSKVGLLRTREFQACRIAGHLVGCCKNPSPQAAGSLQPSVWRSDLDKSPACRRTRRSSTIGSDLRP
jgi:hypothetical protein